MLIDGPVVHLQGCVASVPGEADQVVLAIVYRRAVFPNTDVHRPDVKRHGDFALFLESDRKKQEWVL